MLLSAGRDEPANNLFRVYELVLSPQYSQPAYMPATSLLFSGMLICIFASILGGHEGSVGTSGGQKMAKNRMKLL